MTHQHTGQGYTAVCPPATAAAASAEAAATAATAAPVRDATQGFGVRSGFLPCQRCTAGWEGGT